MHPLQPTEIHLWCADPCSLEEAAIHRAALALLSPDEHERCARLSLASDRRIYLGTRALVRTVLSRYRDVPPATWRFAANAHGRPEIAAPSTALRFNLSNTVGLVVCAVTRDREIGVDVENLERTPPFDIAERFLTRDELATLKSLPPSEQPSRLFAYWTLKESYAKARGRGLTLSFDQFGFDLRPQAPPRIVIDSRLGDDADSWQLAQLRPTERHLVSVCARSRADERLTVTARWLALATALTDEAGHDSSAGIRQVTIAGSPLDA
jgi:4'-phosphopantetheinyl transferase